MNRGIFVAGTDTGIGKTHASCALLYALRAGGVRAIGMKPVASGCRETAHGWRNDDAEALITASAVDADYDDVNPYAFAPPIAPHVAARIAGRAIDLGVIRTAYERLAARAERVVVEGVGGWMVPLADTMMQADLVHALELPVILVVGIRLGGINHALLSARAIAADGIELKGWIANRIDEDMQHADATIAALRLRIDAPLLGTLAFAACSADGAHVLDVRGL